MSPANQVLWKKSDLHGSSFTLEDDPNIDFYTASCIDGRLLYRLVKYTVSLGWLMGPRFVFMVLSVLAFAGWTGEALRLVMLFYRPIKVDRDLELAFSQGCPRQIGRKPFAILCDGDAMRFWQGCCEEWLAKEG